MVEIVHATARADALGEVDLRGEYMFLRDVVQHVYSDDGRGDGHITLEGIRLMRTLVGPSSGSDENLDLRDRGTAVLLPLIVAMSASRRELSAAAEQLYAVMEADLRRPMWEQLRQTGRSEAQILQWMNRWLGRTRYGTLCQVVPAVTPVGKVLQIMLAQRDALQGALALEVYRRQHGQYPSTLKSLEPHYLPAVPEDRSTGLPLLYVLRDSKPVLDGRGLNDVDDGGVWDGSETWPRVPSTGDWVLHPPVIVPLKVE